MGAPGLDGVRGAKQAKKSLHLYVDEPLWRALKQGSLDHGRPMNSILVELAETWASRNGYR